jgi:hypothetical protein
VRPVCLREMRERGWPVSFKSHCVLWMAGCQLLGIVLGWALHAAWHRTFFERAKRLWVAGEGDRRRRDARRLWLCERAVLAVLAFHGNPTNEMMRQAVRKAQEAEEEIEAAKERKGGAL